MKRHLGPGGLGPRWHDWAGVRGEGARIQSVTGIHAPNRWKIQTQETKNIIYHICISIYIYIYIYM